MHSLISMCCVHYASLNNYMKNFSDNMELQMA